MHDWQILECNTDAFLSSLLDDIVSISTLLFKGVIIHFVILLVLLLHEKHKWCKIVVVVLLCVESNATAY